MHRLLLLLSLVVISPGCRKPLPSPDFIEASGKYTDLVATLSDDAYASAEMEGVVGQLGRVPPKSSDYAAAQALGSRITAERARIAAEKLAVANLLNGPRPAPVFPTLTAPAAQAPEPVAAVVVAAPVDPFAVVRGATWAPIAQKFFGCVLSAGPVSLTSGDAGASQQTEAFELHDSPTCRSRVPALTNNLALVAEGKIVLISPRSNLVTTVVAAPPPAPVIAPAPVADEPVR